MAGYSRYRMFDGKRFEACCWSDTKKNAQVVQKAVNARYSRLVAHAGGYVLYIKN